MIEALISMVSCVGVGLFFQFTCSSKLIMDKDITIFLIDFHKIVFVIFLCSPVPPSVTVLWINSPIDTVKPVSSLVT